MAVRKTSADIYTEAYIRERRDLIAVAASIVGQAHVAEDLVQDSWVRWHSRDYPLERARPILMRIVRNLAIDWHRRRRLEFEALETQRLMQEETVDAERIVIGRQRLLRVVAALERLPPRTLLAFRYTRVDGLTLKATGDRIGISESRVSHLVSEAILQIVVALED